MPITPTNLAKNSIIPTTTNKGGVVLWSDNEITWDSVIGLWDSPLVSFNVNLSKNIIIPTNLVKN